MSKAVFSDLECMFSSSFASSIFYGQASIEKCAKKRRLEKAAAIQTSHGFLMVFFGMQFTQLLLWFLDFSSSPRGTILLKHLMAQKAGEIAGSQQKNIFKHSTAASKTYLCSSALKALKCISFVTLVFLMGTSETAEQQRFSLPTAVMVATLLKSIFQFGEKARYILAFYSTFLSKRILRLKSHTFQDQLSFFG